MSDVILGFMLKRWNRYPNQMDAYVVMTDDAGEEKLKLTCTDDEVLPKDKVEYKLTYTNNTDDQLKGLVITGQFHKYFCFRYK